MVHIRSILSIEVSTESPWDVKTQTNNNQANGKDKRDQIPNKLELEHKYLRENFDQVNLVSQQPQEVNDVARPTFKAIHEEVYELGYQVDSLE